MKKMKRTLANIVLSVMLSITILCSLPVQAVNEQKSAITNTYDETSKYSKAYQEYLKLSDEEKAKLEVIPRKYDVPLDSIYEDTIEVKEEASLFNLFGLFAKSTIVTADAETIPTSFGLRNVINVPVRNQGTEGLCWAFSSIKSLETNLALHGYGDYDFSEWHLGLLESKEFGRYGTVDTGGNFTDFENYLARNNGPVLEEEVPYQKKYSVDEYDYLMDLEKKVYVEELVYFPTIDKKYKTYTDEELELFRNKVKKHIMKNGSLYATILAENFNQIEGDTTLYTNVGDKSINHAVSIIGWDDNYPKDNFTGQDGSSPTKNGAYIAMNSWGEDWGDKGIFYISYEDIYVEMELNGVVEASNIPNYEEVKFNDNNLYQAIKEELGNIVIDCNDSAKTLKVSKIGLKYIKKIYELDLSNKNISDLTGIEIFEGLEELNLSNNNITDITPLSNMKQLWFLNLEHNNIIDASPLSNLTETYEINLGYNNISNLEFAKNLKEVSILNLNNNNITDVTELAVIPEDSCLYIDLSGNKNLTGIEKLNNINGIALNDCGLDDSIIPILSKLNLYDIELRNNNIINTYELNFLDNLSLDLSGNKNLDLENIATNVDSLTLSDCNISDLSKFLPNFNGYELDLSSNPIKDSQIQYLNYNGNYNSNGLNISNTNITDVSTLTNITELILDGNKNVTGIENLTQLEMLSMNDCGLNDITFISNLTKLEGLYLNNNNITNVENISNLIEITDLYLDNNNIKNIDNINNLEKLCKLSINNNQITDISVIKDLNKLACIYANNNNITNVSYLEKSNYGDVEFNNNNIEKISTDAFDKTTSAENQNIELNTTAQINKDNRFELPEIIKTLYERRYTEKGKIEFEFYNCSIDYKDNKVIVNPKSYSENNAYIKIKNEKFAGTTFNINYNVVSQITPVELIITQNEDTHNEYLEGQEFDNSRIKVEVLYDNGAIETINDYTVLNGDNLQLGQNSVKIQYKNVEANYAIVVVPEEETIEIQFKDKRMYEWVEYWIGETTRIYYKDPNNLKIIANKADIERYEYVFTDKQEGIIDLTGIEKFTNLYSVAFDGANFTDVSILKKLEKLEFVTIENNPNLTDIKPLLDCKITTDIYLINTGVKDIEFLKDMNTLECLVVNKSKITDIGELLQSENILYLNIESVFEEDELEKNSDNQIILPKFIKETYKNEDFKPQTVSATMYLLKEDGTRNKKESQNIAIKTDEKGNLVVELDKEITANKPEGKREIEVTLTNELYAYELTCTIQYSTEETNDKLMVDTELYNVFQKEDLPYVSYDNEVAQELGKTYTISNPTICTKEILKKATAEKIGITIEEFINDLNTNAEKITIYDADGTEAAVVEMDESGNIKSINMSKTGKTASLMKTGQTIKIEKGTQEITYEVIVKGDINGDGMMTTADSTRLKQILANTKVAKDKEKIAGDVKTEGLITTNDSTLIKQILAGLK